MIIVEASRPLSERDERSVRQRLALLRYRGFEGRQKWLLVTDRTDPKGEPVMTAVPVHLIRTPAPQRALATFDTEIPPSLILVYITGRYRELIRKTVERDEARSKRSRMIPLIAEKRMNQLQRYGFDVTDVNELTPKKDRELMGRLAEKIVSAHNQQTATKTLSEAAFLVFTMNVLYGKHSSGKLAERFEKSYQAKTGTHEPVAAILKKAADSFTLELSASVTNSKRT